MKPLALVPALLALGVLCGWASHERPLADPTIPLSPAQAQRALDEMARHRKPLDRPLVILGGFLDPGIGDNIVASEIRRHVADDRIVAVSYFFATSFDDCRRARIRRLRAEPPYASGGGWWRFNQAM